MLVEPGDSNFMIKILLNEFIYEAAKWITMYLYIIFRKSSTVRLFLVDHCEHIARHHKSNKLLVQPKEVQPFC